MLYNIPNNYIGGKSMRNNKISIHTEFLISVITAIVVIAVIIGGIGVYAVNEIILNTSTEIMSNSCEKRRQS